MSKAMDPGILLDIFKERFGGQNVRKISANVRKPRGGRQAFKIYITLGPIDMAAEAADVPAAEPTEASDDYLETKPRISCHLLLTRKLRSILGGDNVHEEPFQDSFLLNNAVRHQIEIDTSKITKVNLPKILDAIESSHALRPEIEIGSPARFPGTASR